MMSFVRTNDGTIILVAADLIAVVEELTPTEFAPARSRVKLRDHSFYDVQDAMHQIVEDYTDLLRDESIVPVRRPNGEEDWAATRAAYGNRLHVDRWPAPTPEQIRERMTTSPGKDAP